MLIGLGNYLAVNNQTYLHHLIHVEVEFLVILQMNKRPSNY